MDILLLVAVGIIGITIGFCGWNVFSFFVQLVTIMEYEKGLRYVRGKFVGVLAAGQYWICPIFSEIKKIDIRPKFLTISGQEIVSADGVALKVSLAAKYEVDDPVAATHKIENFESSLYLLIQMNLRDILGSSKIDEIMEKREDFGKKLFEKSGPRVFELGLKLHSVDIKEIMFPGELKKILSQVVKAQKEGQAALEKARGETAALRSLANAAKMLQENPGLLQLRMLQQIGESGGNTLVYGVPGNITPLVSTKKIVEKDPKKTRAKSNQTE